MAETTVAVRLPGALHKQLVKHAAACSKKLGERVTISTMLRMLLGEAMRDRETRGTVGSMNPES